MIVALYVSVSRAYPERLRPSILAAFSAAWVVPSIVGPLAAGSVTEHLGWRWVFLGIPLLVVLPAGAGVREAVIVVLLAGLLTTPEATALALTSRGVLMLTDGLLALAAGVLPRRR